MVILAILLAADPKANEAITPEVCEFGVLAWHSDTEAGRGWVDWTEGDWDHHNDPPPSVLDRLEEAISFLDPIPMPTGAVEPKPTAADQTFGAALMFLEYLGTLAYQARKFQPNTDRPDAWQDPAMTYAMAFVAWLDLTHLLTPAVRTEARRVYPPGSPAIRLGKARPTPTMIEALADELGLYFRNTVYQDRRHPLEPDTERITDEAKARATARQVAQGKPAEPLGWGADFDELMRAETRVAVLERLGLKTYGDCHDLMMNEWKAQDPASGRAALSLLRCDSIDFDELRVQLIREAEAVSNPSDPSISLPADLPARLEAMRAAIEALSTRDNHSRTGDREAAASPKLPNLKPHDRKAWQLVFVSGMTQTQAAKALNREYGTFYTQGCVSRMITRAKKHAQASGAADLLPKKVDRPKTVDPGRLEVGARTDRRKPRPSDTAGGNEDDDW